MPLYTLNITNSDAATATKGMNARLTLDAAFALVLVGPAGFVKPAPGAVGGKLVGVEASAHDDGVLAEVVHGKGDMLQPGTKEHGLGEVERAPHSRRHKEVHLNDVRAVLAVPASPGWPCPSPVFNTPAFLPCIKPDQRFTRIQWLAGREPIQRTAQGEHVQVPGGPVGHHRYTATDAPTLSSLLSRSSTIPYLRYFLM